MNKEDARYQTLQPLHERRKQVIRLHQQGFKTMQLVHMTGLSYPTVRKTLDLFEQGGWSAIKPAGCGRAKGASRLLAPEQEVHIPKTICDKRPEAVKAWLDEHYPAIEAKAKAEAMPLQGKLRWHSQ